MALKSIKLINWMNISECELSFQDGINIIEGKVGQGKSAIFAAVAYVLGDYRRGDSWKDYVKTGSKFFEIELYYQFGNDENNIMKVYFKGDPKGSVYKEITYQGETKKGEEVPIFLGQHLDQQMLNAVIFNLQGSQSLSQMTPMERRDIFKKIFNSDFGEIDKKIIEDQKLIQKTLDMKEAQSKVLKEKNYNFFRIIPVDPNELVQLQDELSKAQDNENIKLRIKQYSEKIQLLNTYQTRSSKLLASRTNLLNDEAKYNKEYEEVLSNKTLDSISLKEKQLLSETLNRELETMVLDEATLKASLNVNDLEKEITSNIETLSRCMAEIALNTKYLNVHKAGKCTECGQDCNSTNVAKFEDILRVEELNKIRLTSLIASLRTQIEDYKKKIQAFGIDISTKKNRIYSVDNDVVRLEQQSKSYDNLIVRIKSVDLIGVASRIQEVEKDIISNQVEIDTVTKWIQDNPKPEEAEMSRGMSDIQKAIEEVQSRIQGNLNKEVLNEKLKSDRIQDEELITSLNLEINEHTIEIERLGKVRQIFTTDFPNFINMKACKILEAYMNNFFATTKDKFQIALQSDKKGISFYYKANDEVDWRNLKMVSGFESALSTLGFKVAVAYAFGSDIIFLDEPDGAADSQTSEKLFETILSIGGFKQIHVITHKPEVVDILMKGGASGFYVDKGKFTPLEY